MSKESKPFKVHCELCRTFQVSSELGWCSHCSRLLCRLCMDEAHPQGQQVVARFEVGALTAVKARLRCEDFKSRMKLRAFFVRVAEELRGTETGLLDHLITAFPTDTAFPDETDALSPDLDSDRAATLAKEFLAGAGMSWTEPTSSLLETLERMGSGPLAESIAVLLPLTEERQAEPAEMAAVEDKQSDSPPPNALLSQAVANTQRVRQRRKHIGAQKGPHPQILILRGAGAELETLFPSQRLAYRLPLDMTDGQAVVAKSGSGFLCLPGLSSGAYQLSNSVLNSAPRGLPWSKRCKGPILSRRKACLLQHNDINYLIAGFTDLAKGQVTNSLELLDQSVGGRRWHAGPSLQEARGAAAAAVHNNCLYVFGGIRSDGQLSASMEKLDLARLEAGWGCSRPGFKNQGMPMGTAYAAAGTAGDSLILVGGISSLSFPAPPQATPFTFILQDNDAAKIYRWLRGPQLNYARAGHGLVSLDGVLYAIGGYGDGRVPGYEVACSIEKLDNRSSNWVWELMEERLAEPAIHATILNISSD